MPVFSYKARDKKGMVVKGILEAPSQVEAKKVLSGRDLIVLAVTSGGMVQLTDRIGKFFSGWRPAVGLDELIVFNRQLQTSYSVGIPWCRH